MAITTVSSANGKNFLITLSFVIQYFIVRGFGWNPVYVTIRKTSD